MRYFTVQKGKGKKAEFWNYRELAFTSILSTYCIRYSQNRSLTDLGIAKLSLGITPAHKSRLSFNVKELDSVTARIYSANPASYQIKKPELI